jgi:hypothetical protein
MRIDRYMPAFAVAAACFTLAGCGSSGEEADEKLKTYPAPPRVAPRPGVAAPSTFPAPEPGEAANLESRGVRVVTTPNAESSNPCFDPTCGLGKNHPKPPDDNPPDYKFK